MLTQDQIYEGSLVRYIMSTPPGYTNELAVISKDIHSDLYIVTFLKVDPYRTYGVNPLEWDVVIP